MLCSTLFVVTLTMFSIVSSDTFCDDWTLCQRVRCAAPPDPCPEDKPYLLYGECGCCQYCSETPRIGPCGQCGKDVVCKEPYPICHGDNYTVTLDYCGCCRVCKSIIEIGGHCDDFSVCAAGLECCNGTCKNAS